MHSICLGKKGAFVAVCGLSLVAGTGSYSLVPGTSRYCGFFCGAWTLEHWSSTGGTQAWAALQHVGSSWTRDQTYVPCIGRQILNHWTTREVLSYRFLLITVIFIARYLIFLMLLLWFFFNSTKYNLITFLFRNKEHINDHNISNSFKI